MANIDFLKDPLFSEMREYYDNVVLRVGRAIVSVEQDQWTVPSEEWTIEMMKDNGIYDIAFVAFGEAVEIIQAEMNSDYRGGHC